jgi:indole-3-glycerol phosphate synthase
MTILEKIVAQKQKEIARMPSTEITSILLRQLMDNRSRRYSFYEALRNARGSMGLIAEVKKASPSAGLICENFDPVTIACEYQKAGAHCLSVLTDEHFFQGSLEYLRQIRQAVDLPLLRKDFIIDKRQIMEAIQYGADAILLIVAILDDTQLKEFHALATSIGLSVLVEAHDETEMRRAVAAGAKLIGINNRDLKTFKVDLGTTERLAALFKQISDDAGALLVAESGIHSRCDVERLQRCGARAILVGESLMREKDVRTKARELLGLDNLIV